MRQSARLLDLDEHPNQILNRISFGQRFRERDGPLDRERRELILFAVDAAR